MKLSFFVLILFSLSSYGEVIPFETALKELVSKNTQVRVQKTNLDAAESVALSKKLKFLPNLSLEGRQAKEYLGDTNALSTSRSYLVTASLNLFRGGADWSAMQAASANRDYQMALFEKNILDAEEASAKVLLDFIETQKRRSILEKNLKDFKNFLVIGQERYRKGLLPLQEVEKISIDVGNLEARLQDSESLYNSSREQLLRLWENDNVQTEWPWKLRMGTVEVSQLVNAKPNMEVHPQFKTSQKQVEVAEQDSKTQYRLMLPSIDLSYSQGRYESSSYNGPGWESLVTLKIPLFSGLSDYAQYRQKSEERNASEIRFEQEKRNSISEQALAQQNFKIALATALARDKTSEIAHRLLQTNILRFRSGRATANELNIEQNRVTESELLTYQGWKTAHMALLKLYHSFGLSVLR